MDKKLFADLLDSVREMQSVRRGSATATRVTTAGELREPDVAELRESVGLSQPLFAQALGISLSTLRNWEQGRRRPEGPARVLLHVFKRHPEAVVDAVTAARPRRKATRAARRSYR